MDLDTLGFLAFAEANAAAAGYAATKLLTAQSPVLGSVFAMATCTTGIGLTILGTTAIWGAPTNAPKLEHLKGQVFLATTFSAAALISKIALGWIGFQISVPAAIVSTAVLIGIEFGMLFLEEKCIIDPLKALQK